MTRSSTKAGLAACLALGLADLVAVNVWVFPVLFAPPTTTGGALSSPPVVAQGSQKAGLKSTEPVSGVAPGRPVDPPKGTDGTSKPKVAGAAKPGSRVTSPKPAAATEPPRPAVVATAPKPAVVTPSVAQPKPVSPKPVPPKPAPPVLVMEQMVLRFPTAKAVPDRAALAELSAFAKRVRAVGKPVALWVDGHADQRGNPVLNRRLSQSRARQVVGVLWRMGIAPKKRKATGFGSDKPEAAANSPEAWARNRRVEIRVQIKKSSK